MYDASRLANFGRDTSIAYSRFRRVEEKMREEIHAALADDVSPTKIAYDLMGRCSTHDAQVDLLSVLLALAQMEKIPMSVVEPYETGIRPKRI